jgi:ribose-phosphate pyrophosphokinase
VFKPFSFDDELFCSPERFASERQRREPSPRGQLVIASCQSGRYMAEKIVLAYQAQLGIAEGNTDDLRYLPDVDFRFADSETCARIEAHISGSDVFLVQALYDPRSNMSVDDNYMAFLITARTFREHGAKHLAAVVPYLTYSRQDKPTAFKREPTTAKLMAELSVQSGIDRLITWHLHTDQVRGFYGGTPVHALSPLTLFADIFWDHRGRGDAIVVAPDVGASKLASQLCRVLGMRCAVAAKHRPHAGEAVIDEIIGDFADRTTAIVLDDMVSSGGTLEAVIDCLVDEKGIDRVEVAISHSLCQPAALHRFEKLHDSGRLHRLVVTNSIPQTERLVALPFVEVRDLSEVFNRVINRIHYDRSVSALFNETELLEKRGVP